MSTYLPDGQISQNEVETVAEFSNAAQLVDAIAHAIAEERNRIIRHIHQKAAIESEFVRRAMVGIANDIRDGKIAE